MRQPPRCRIVVFTRAHGYDLRNPDLDDPSQLPGTGGFYWATPRDAYRRARRLLRTDPAVTQVKLETISARFVARLYR